MSSLKEWFPPRTSPTKGQIDKHMATTLALQHSGMTEHGKAPYATILVGPDHETVLLTHMNVSAVDHSEACLGRLASVHFSPKFLWTCTMYSTWEPCHMCAGTAYWANIGRIIFAASIPQLRELTGPVNFTPGGSCAGVLEGGQKDIEVIGPVKGWDKKIMEDADWFWSKTEARQNAAQNSR